MTPLRWIAPTLLLASLALAAVPPAAAACSYLPIATVGGSTYPAQGVYVESGCYSPPTTPWTSVSGGTTGGVPSAGCVTIPPLFILTTQVPGSGQTYCAPSVGGQSVSEPLPPVPDSGVTICVSAGNCYWISLWALYGLCQTAGTTTVPLPPPAPGNIFVQCA